MDELMEDIFKEFQLIQKDWVQSMKKGEYHQ